MAKTSKKTFPAEIVGLPLTEAATRCRRSVSFFWEDDGKSFRVNADVSEYAGAMRDLKRAQDAWETDAKYREYTANPGAGWPK